MTIRDGIAITTLERMIGAFCAASVEIEVSVEFDFIPAQMATAFTPYYESEIDILSTSVPTSRDERTFLAREILNTFKK